MDDTVLASMARWPNVPAAFGWLSLSPRGQWCLHPAGQGWGHTETEPGQPITNPQIVTFIGRNYQSDDTGRWFFQNGPQKVYVRLDAAPWILELHPGPDTGLHWQTHIGLPYGPIKQWWVDDNGYLYAQAPQGAGRVLDRDLARAAEALVTLEHQTLADCLDTLPSLQSLQTQPLAVGLVPGPQPLSGINIAPVGWLPTQEVAKTLGFQAQPAP
ncbi:DUF2946 family protein [Castellaniella sp.]|uniref:DUF2946 family protein n=1 Tax=Castellaniella sp. TaxID=1955812 RepID=UPI003C74D9C5